MNFHFALFTHKITNSGTTACSSAQLLVFRIFAIVLRAFAIVRQTFAIVLRAFPIASV